MRLLAHVLMLGPIPGDTLLQMVPCEHQTLPTAVYISRSWLFREVSAGTSHHDFSYEHVGG
jgi:hypothetical protein